MIPLPYKLAIVGVALVGTFFLGYTKGLEKYHEYRANVASEMELLKLDNQRKLEAMQAVADKAGTDYRLARAEFDRLGRVIRVQPTTCQGLLPTAPTAASGLDATAEARTIDPAQCEAYLNAGIEDAAKLMHLQQFLIDQHEAAK